MNETMAEIHDELLMHKYLYYECADPIISDRDYDTLERIYEKLTGTEMVVGFPRTAYTHALVKDGPDKVKDRLYSTMHDRIAQIRRWKGDLGL